MTAKTVLIYSIVSQKFAKFKFFNHAKDDKLASYTDTEKAVKRFPDCTFISFESGGHLMTGHGEEIKNAIYNFTKSR